MKRVMMTIVAILISCLVFVACSNNEDTTNEISDEPEPIADSDTSSNEEEQEEEEGTKAEENSTEVTISGEATYEDHLLTVEGETNLPESSSVFVHLNTLDSSSFINVSGSTDVESDGSFYFETDIPDKYEHGLDLKVRFRPEDQSDDSVQEVFGESGENLEGPFVRLYESTDEVKQEASTSVYMPLDDDGNAYGEITEPEWQEPEDYGEEEIRIETDLEKDEEFIYVDGKSNLIEGSELSIDLLKDGGRTKAPGIKEHVYPDGSFQGQLDVSEIDEEIEDYEVRVKFKPSEYDWENVSEHYGTGGEHMSGDLVEDWNEDQQVIFTTPVE